MLGYVFYFSLHIYVNRANIKNFLFRQIVHLAAKKKNHVTLINIDIIPTVIHRISVYIIAPITGIVLLLQVSADF